MLQIGASSTLTILFCFSFLFLPHSLNQWLSICSTKSNPFLSKKIKKKSWNTNQTGRCYKISNLSCIDRRYDSVAFNRCIDFKRRKISTKNWSLPDGNQCFVLVRKKLFYFQEWLQITSYSTWLKTDHMLLCHQPTHEQILIYMLCKENFKK